MLLKRLVSGSLAFCLAALLVISSPIEARADAQDLLNVLAATPSNARPVVVTEPDEVALLPGKSEEIELEDDTSAEDVNEILAAGANSIDDFDPAELVPLTPEEIEYARTHENEILEPENEASPQLAIEAGVAVAALAAIAFTCYSSAVTLTSFQGTYNTLNTYAQKDDDWSYSMTYKHDNTIETKVLKARMLQAVLKKLDALKEGTTQALALTKEDREALAFAYFQSGCVVNFDNKSVNLKSIEGYKYYYFCPYRMSYAPESISVLYSSAPIAYVQNGSSYSTRWYPYQYVRLRLTHFSLLISMLQLIR